MNKFNQLYNLIMQEINSEDGINTNAIGAVGRAYAGTDKGYPTPNDNHWYWNKKELGLDIDITEYDKIVKEIRDQKFTIDNILNLMQYFINNKKIDVKVLFSNPLLSTAEKFVMLIDLMLEQGKEVFPSEDDFKYLKIFKFMEDNLMKNQKLSLIDLDHQDMWKYANKVQETLGL